MALDTTVGGTSSDSYITLAEWQAYWAARGVDLSQHGHDGSHEANLRQAADWIDRNWRYVGYKTTKAQARQWPRYTTITVDGWEIDSDEIPQGIKDAQAELAYMIHEGFNPSATIESGVASVRSKAGPVETQKDYAGTKGMDKLPVIERLLAPYVGAGVNQVRLLRA